MRQQALALAFFTSLWSACGDAADVRTFDDASLHAVQFLDAHEGWAVGDQGTVWHTMDGGVVWERQPTGTRATLTCIFMHDFQAGYVGGREGLPFNPGSVGVLLFTRNGGGQWAPLSRQPLSGVHAMRFFDGEHGWLLGEATDQHPTGVYFTTNGGRTWNALRGDRLTSWTSGAFLEFDYLLAGGHGATLAGVRQGVVLPLNVDWLKGTSIRDFAGSNEMLWVVGDQCQILASDDQGRTWQRPPLELPAAVRKMWNLRAVAAVGRKVWAAGRPGSVILHSADAGATWSYQRTGQPLPIHDLCFVDEKHGWAVGALGAILATVDGGNTWTVQRQGGTAAALLWLYHDGNHVPLGTVARYGVELGYHNVALALTAPDADRELQGAESRPARVAEAFRAVGGAYAETATRFPLAPTRANEPLDALIERWDRLLEARSTDELLSEVVLAIRIWRPAVVVSQWTDATGSNPVAAALAAFAVRKAFDVASDSRSFPEQVEFFALPAHAVAKLYAQVPAEIPHPSGSVIRHSTEEFSSQLAESYADAAEAGMALRHERYAAAESASSFVLIKSRLEGADRHQSLVQGTSIGSGARRVLPPAPENVDAIQAVIEKKRNLLAIANRTDGIGRPEMLLAQLQETLGTLGPAPAGNALFQIGRRYAEQGRWDFAQATFIYFVQTYPQHPLAIEAYRWLLAYQVSGEARLRYAKLAVIEHQRVQFAKSEKDSSAPGDVRQSTGRRVIQAPAAQEAWASGALECGERLQKTSVHLWADPRVQLCLAAAHRQLGVDHLKLADLHYARLTEANPRSHWAAVVAMEKWVYARTATPPRPVAVSTYTEERPHLDGVLDDGCWQSARPFKLRGAVEREKQFTTVAWVRHDGQFLYLAADCKYPDASYRVGQTERSARDADLSGFDRLTLFLDLDRDYTTAYRLEVDARGLVAESCWDDRTWDPKWYVATSQDDSGWRLEAAIPLEELTDDRMLTGGAWAFNLMRVVPGHGVSAFSLPASPEGRLDGLTHLKFLKGGQSLAVEPQAN